MPHGPTASKVVRHMFAAGAIIFGATGLVTGDAKLLAAGGAFGILWTTWDLFQSWVVDPFLELVHDIWQGGGGIGRTPPNLRPTLDDTIRYLESHIAGNTSRGLDVQSALRLEEIYRTIKKEPAKGRAVLERVLERYPDEQLIVGRLREYPD